MLLRCTKLQRLLGGEALMTNCGWVQRLSELQFPHGELAQYALHILLCGVDCN